MNALHLSGNQLTTVPAALGGMTALTSLHLGGNQLTSVPAALGKAVQADPIKPTLKAPGT